MSKSAVLATLKAAVSYLVANFLPVLLEQLRKNASIITSSLVLSLLPTSTGFGMEDVNRLDKERHEVITATSSSSFLLAGEV